MYTSLRLTIVDFKAGNELKLGKMFKVEKYKYRKCEKLTLNFHSWDITNQLQGIQEVSPEVG